MLCLPNFWHLVPQNVVLQDWIHMRPYYPGWHLMEFLSICFIKFGTNYLRSLIARWKLLGMNTTPGKLYPGHVVLFRLRIHSLMFQAYLKVILGVSKKCCFCCALLANLLASGTTKPHFAILGSYATIFPWVAPYGIHVDLLHQIRNKLFEVLNHQVETAWSEANTMQTSPM